MSVPILLLSLLTPAGAADCFGGHAWDPTHFALFPEENFGTDWIAQVRQTALRDVVLKTLSQPEVRPYLTLTDGARLGPIDVQYDWRLDGFDLELVGDGVVFTFPIAGTTTLAGVRCDVAGALGVALEPTLSGTDLSFQPIDVELPELCANQPVGALFQAAVEDDVELELEDLLAQVQVDLGSLVGDLALPDGFADPFSGLQLQVVDAPLGGGVPFVQVGGPLVAEASCARPKYPLFDPDAFRAYRTALGGGDVSIALSMRATDAVYEALAGGLEGAVVMQSGLVSASFTEAHVAWKGLASNDPACACTTGDVERWLEPAETDPRLGFQSFFQVSLPGVDIFGWNPGPVTLQLDGHARPGVGADGMLLQTGFDRANAYGPWYTDGAIQVIEWVEGTNYQWAGNYDCWLADAVGYTATCGSDLEVPVPLGIATLGAVELTFDPTRDVGFLTPCEARARLASASWSARYSWSAPASPEAVCGATDTDGDGLFDTWSADTDGDGVFDASEVDSDPFEADTDGDGLSDGVEVSVGTDPAWLDSDLDELSDWAEVVREDTDPTSFDTDGDGAGDGCETGLGLDPLEPDSDLDGLLDGDEDLVRLACP